MFSRGLLAQGQAALVRKIASADVEHELAPLGGLEDLQCPGVSHAVEGYSVHREYLVLDLEDALLGRLTVGQDILDENAHLAFAAIGAADYAEAEALGTALLQGDGQQIHR